MQAEFEELARQRQDLEAQELEVQHMTRTRNLNAAREARVTNATSAVGSRHYYKKEQAPRCASSQIASQRSLTPSGIEVIGTGNTRTVASPPVSSQDETSQNVKVMVQDIVKASLIQLRVISQETRTQSQAQPDTVDPEPPQIEDISSEGEISESDQEDPHSGTRPVVDFCLSGSD